MNEVHRWQAKHQKQELPEFRVGDDVRVSVRFRDTKRLSQFTGTVIADDGAGISRNITVRRISHGVGIERVFPIHGPVLEKLEVVRRGKARRAKLYYLREKSGKRARVKERRYVAGAAK